MIRKDVIITVLTTFCLTATLFTVIPIRSSLPYDPWADMRGPYEDPDVPDGTINMRDIGYVASMFMTSGDPTKNVTVTNWPTWLVNQSTTLVKEMPLCRIYYYNVTSGPYTTALNVTPPIGKTWYISEIRMHEPYGQGWFTMKIKGVTQFYNMPTSVFGTWFTSVKFPAIMKFTDTESIIVEAAALQGTSEMSGYFLVIGWEE